MAEFVMQVADEMPTPRRGGGGAGSEWPARLAEVVQNHPGKAVLLAVCSGEASASRVKTRMTGGRNGKPATIDLPGGVDAWEIVATVQYATVEKDDVGAEGFEGYALGDRYKTGNSELWVQYNGPAKGSKS